MIYLDETRRPIFTSRKEQRTLKTRMEPVSQDATGVVLVCAVALAVTLVLAFLASPWCPEWMFIRRAGAEEMEPVATARPQYLVKVDTELNARAKPSADAERLFELWNNCCVTVLEEKDGWALIEWWQKPGQQAWVCAEYLEEASPK